MWTGFPEATTSRGNKYKRDTFSRLCWSKQNVTIEDGGYFVDLERFAAIKDGNQLNDLDNIIEHAIALGIVPKNVQVYGMSDRDKKHINDIPEWIDFIDFVKKAFIALNVNDGLYTRCVVNKVKAELGGAVTEFLEKWNNVGALLNDGLFKNYLDKVAQMDKTAPIASWTSVTNMAMYMDVKTTVAKDTDALTVEWYALLKTYSMLSFINWSNVDRTNYTIVIDYINMVDAVKT